VVIKLGLILYDIFARSYKVMPNHHLDMKADTLRKYPKMNPDVLCTATYYDAWMPYPERICIELVLDTEAAAQKQATALNYVSAVDSSGETVTLRDELTGETIEVKPKVVINAAGPWIDFVNRAINRETNMIGGTKGSHLIVDHPELLAQISDHEIFFEHKDGRIVLILPFMGKVMIGTTDIRIHDPDEAVCTEAEIDYMLDMIQRVFPTIRVDRSQIVFNLSGVRPLPNSDKSYTGNVSRDHSIEVVPPGNGLKYPILSLVGGKWTTFRAFAEQTADRTLKTLGLQRKVSTKDMAIGGGRDYPQDEVSWVRRVHESNGLPLERVQTLFRRYGTRAEMIAAFIAQGEDQTLHYQPDYSRREIEFLARHEKIVRLDDLILRRSLIAWLGGINEATLRELLDILGSVLNW
jgi:glycerol-3-phosphate dehydrogenase